MSIHAGASVEHGARLAADMSIDRWRHVRPGERRSGRGGALLARPVGVDLIRCVAVLGNRAVLAGRDLVGLRRAAPSMLSL